MIKSGRATVVVGGQFGSEAKGLAASWLASDMPKDVHSLISTTNAGAQAGHTTVLPSGLKFVCYHLPTIGVLIPNSLIYLNAGSIIDMRLLEREIYDVSMVLGYDPLDLANRIMIHPNAAVVTDVAKAVEASSKGTTHIASTGKGVGAALSAKIMRQLGATVGTSGGCPVAGVRVAPVDLVVAMRHGDAVTVEIPQGTGLGINNPGIYPTCTSRDCWAMQGLTDAGIPYHYVQDVVMVCRTFPIRVGHTYDPDGAILGNSGRFYEDSVELNWDDFPGVTPEITTVTKRVRRIATWSEQQYEHALLLNRPTVVMLTFVNYLFCKTDFQERITQMVRVEDRVGISPRHLYSYGPRQDEVSGNVWEVVKALGW